MSRHRSSGAAAASMAACLGVCLGARLAAAQEAPRPSVEAAEAAAKGAEAFSAIAAAMKPLATPRWRDGLRALKRIAADAGHPAYARAFAVQVLADVFMNGARLKEQANVIFEDEPYRSFLRRNKGGKPRTLLGMVRIYEHALRLEPGLPVSHYRIAEYYADHLLNARKSGKTFPLREKYLKRIHAHISKGDAFPLDGYAKRFHLRYNLLAYAWWLKGRVYGSLYELEGNDDYRDKAEASFEKSFAILNAPHKDASLRKITTLWASLYYAIFLKNAYGQQKAAKIRELLDQYSDLGESKPNPVQFMALRIKEDLPQYRDFKAEVLDLPQFSPKFSAFLSRL